jgi:glyoxylase-like metal-dependent hydrolase (beta-lactamase superfamily II)
VSEPGAQPAIDVAGWTVTLLDLGAIHAPLRWVFPDAAEDELAWLPSGGLLCRRDGEAVLVDCGLGPYRDIFGLDVRHVALADALAAAACRLDEVSAAILTHLDADHAGGIVTRDSRGELLPALGRARIVMLDEALEVLDGRVEQRSELAETIGSALHAARADVHGVADGSKVHPGLRLHAAPGHRAGHACVELSAGGERFVFLADVIHAREHVEHPEWDFLHDSEPDVALRTRRRWIDGLAGSGAAVACSHVDGFGRIERGARGTPVWVDVA